MLGALAIHYDERRVSVAGREVELTATEYEVLRVLSLNAGRVSLAKLRENRSYSATSSSRKASTSISGPSTPRR